MRYLLLLSVLLLGSLWAAAQNNPSQSSPSQTTPAGAGGETTVQGTGSSLRQHLSHRADDLGAQLKRALVLLRQR